MTVRMGRLYYIPASHDILVMSFRFMSFRFVGFFPKPRLDAPGKLHRTKKDL
jgi:hypothetical protein